MAKEKTVMLLRSKAVNLFKVLGYKVAGKWDDEKLCKKINRLPELVDPDVKLDDPAMQDLLVSLLGGIENGNVIEIQVDKIAKEEASAETKAPIKEKTKTKTKPKSAKRPKIKVVNKTKTKIEKPVKEDKLKAEKPIKEDKSVKEDKPEPQKRGKIDRITAALHVIEDSKAKKTAVKTLVERASALYNKNGGKTNDREALFITKNVIKTMVILELITVEDGFVIKA